MLEALDHFTRGTDRESELQEALNGDRLDGERLMVFIEPVDRGRFAQRLAGDLEQLVPPRYVRDALEHLAEACAG